MQKLHLVGFTTDQTGLILSARRGARSGSYTLVLDEALAQAVEELRARQDEEAGVDARVDRTESRLPVSEIQARLRRGKSLKDVAKDAGVDPEWVERFAAPVFAERAEVIARVQSTFLKRQRLGPSGVRVGDAVRRNLVERGVVMAPDEFTEAWTTHQRPDGRWIVRFGFTYRGNHRLLKYEVRPNGEVVASDPFTSQLSYVTPPKRATPRPKPPAPAEAAGKRAAVVGSGFRPDAPVVRKASSRPAKEREKAAAAMTKAAARRAVEGERAAARKARERAQLLARREREARVEAQRREREAKARAREAAAAARLAAAEQAERERRAAAAAAERQAERERARAARERAREQAARKAAAKKKAAPAKKAAKATKPTKATAKKTATKQAAKATTKKAAAKQAAAAKRSPARTEAARKVVARARAERARKAAVEARRAAPATPAKTPASTPPPAAARREDGPARPERPAPRPEAAAPPPTRRPPRPEQRVAAPPPDGTQRATGLRGAAIDVHGPEATRALFRAGLAQPAGDPAADPATRPVPAVAPDEGSENGQAPQARPSGFRRRRQLRAR